MDFTLWTKKRYVNFYNKNNRHVRFVQRLWTLHLAFRSDKHWDWLTISKIWYKRGKPVDGKMLFVIERPMPKLQPIQGD